MITNKGHKTTVTAIAASSDGSLIATGGIDGSLRLWNTRPFTIKASLDYKPDPNRVKNRIHSLAYSPKGLLLAAATGWTATVEIWKNTKLVEVLTPHSARITAVAWSPDGNLLAVGGADYDPNSSAVDDDSPDDSIPPMLPPTVRLWSDGKIIGELSGLENTIHSIVFSDDGSKLAAGGSGPQVIVWDLLTQKVLATVSVEGEVGHVAFVKEDLVIVSSKGTVRLKTPTFAESMKIEGVVGSSGAAWADSDVLVAGTYEQILFSSWDSQYQHHVDDRAYDMCRVGNEIWIVTSDTLLCYSLDGNEQSRHSLR